MSYGPNFSDLFRRAAEHVDRILRGAKPSNIPIEQPTKFDLVINLKTAKALGLSVPQTLLAARRRGDRMTDRTAPLQAETSDVAVPRKIRSRLFLKYAGLFVAVVCVALVTNGVFEIWVSYREHKDALIQIQHEQAELAAAKIGQFIKEIESQVGWTTQLLWSAGTIEQRRFDALRLLRQVPAITELAQVDASGKEQLRVSRLAMDVVGSGLDLSKEPKFTDAVKNKVYYGPVYFRRESEPYMTLSLAGTRRDAGVSIAEVNLKLIWDVVSKIKVGEHGHAYVVDAQGRLIAHPDISLVLRNTDMTRLAQVQAAREHEAGAAAEDIETATDIQGRQVLTAFAPVAPLGWTVFVELPVDEAYQPLITSMQRTALVLFGALFLAALAGIFLARRMVVPIQALRTGAARIGGGDLSQRISVKTGDELEALADQFNDMAGRLQESYADLEQKVEVRTHELSEVAGAADRDLRGAQSHQQFAGRAGAGVSSDAGERRANLRGQFRHAVSGRGWRGAARLRCTAYRRRLPSSGSADHNGRVDKLPSVVRSRRGRRFISSMSRKTPLTSGTSPSSWPPSNSEASEPFSTCRCSRTTR